MEFWIGYLALVFINYWVIIGATKILAHHDMRPGTAFLFVSLFLIAPTIILLVVLVISLLERYWKYIEPERWHMVFDWAIPKDKR